MLGVHQRVVVFLLFCAVTMSAQTPCTVVMPITVIDSDGSIVKDLPPESLTTQTEGISLKSGIVPDNSKRRILIVLDGAPNLTKVSRATEKWIARTIVEKARPGDSFALISGNAAPVRVQFGADKALVLEAIDRFPKGRTGKKLSLLDAVYEGSTWFGTPEFGDSVLLLPGAEKPEPTTPSREGSTSFSVESEACDAPYSCTTQSTEIPLAPWSEPSKVERRVASKISYKNLESALIDRGLREFVASQSGTSDWISDHISHHSGGLRYIYPELGRDKRKFRLDDASRNTLSDEAAKVFDAIAFTYRLSVTSSETQQLPILLELRREIKNELPPFASALYPRAIPGCPSKR